MRSSVVGSAQCRSSKASTSGCARAPAVTQASSAAICRRRNSSGASLAARSSRQRHVEQRRQQRDVFGGVELDRSGAPSRDRRAAARRECRRRRSAAGPSPRSGAKACSGATAKRPIRPRCAAYRPGGREIPRSGATCRGRARRRSAETALRPPARAPSAAAASSALPRARPAASARAARSAGRRRWRARSGNSVTGSGTPFSSCAPRSSATNRPATCRRTLAVVQTDPGSAAACTRAATLGASPNTSPAESTTTAPVSTPIRASSFGRPEFAFLALISASAR